MHAWYQSWIDRIPPAHRPRLAYALLLLVTLLVYLPALNNGYIWDDDNYVTDNVTLRTAEGLSRMWLEPRSIPQYYPLVHTTYWIEYQLWGERPFGYHLVNVILHALGAMLLWRLLRELAVPGAFLGALLFVIHPLQVESVAWVTERKNTLSLIFYLGSMLLYLRFALHEQARRVWPADRRSWRLYIGALLLFVAALLSKTVTSTLPAALVVLVAWKRWPLKPREWRAFLPLLPFFVFGLSLAFLTIQLEKEHVGAMGSEWDYNLLERCLIAGRVIWFYAGKLVWPAPLIFIYERWQIDQQIWTLYLYPLAFLAVLVGLWLGRRRWGLGPLVAVCLYAGTLTPALGFFNVYPMRYSFVADHFSYHASIWLLALAGALLARLFAWRPALRWALPVLVVVLGTLTWQHTHAFEDAEALWRDVLSKNDDAWIAHNNLGLILLHRSDMREAIEHFERVLELKPEHVNAPINLGIAYERLEAWEEAHEYYRIGLQRNAHNPLAIKLVGNYFARRDMPEQALICYDKALELRNYQVQASPAILDLLHNRAMVLADMGRDVEALTTARQALELASRFREMQTAQRLQTLIDSLERPD